MAAGETTVYLLAGMRIRIEIPVDVYSGDGYFPYDPGTYDTKQPPFTFRGKNVNSGNMTNGFWLEDEDIGGLGAAEGGLAVEYHHKKNGRNRIWFKAATGELATVIVDSVPIHDHSSVVQGGPAFGSYFHDSDVLD